MAIDHIDSKALARLMTDGRVAWSELAGALGLSAPSTAERVRKLEEQGVIRGYAAVVDPGSAGCALAAFVAVTLGQPANRAAFLELVRREPRIQECHHVAGDTDYLLKVRCADVSHLETLVGDELKGLPGVVRTHTTIVLSTVKETTVLPLATEAPPARARRRRARSRTPRGRSGAR